MTFLSIVSALAWSFSCQLEKILYEDFFREVLSTCYSALDFCSRYLHSWDAVTQCRWKNSDLHRLLCIVMLKAKILCFTVATNRSVLYNYCFSAMGWWRELLKILVRSQRFVDFPPAISAFWIVFSRWFGFAAWTQWCDCPESQEESWTGKDESNLIWWLVNPTHELQPVCQHDTLYKALSQKFLLLSEPTDFADARNKNPKLS